MTDAELTGLAAGVAKSLRWAAFLVLVSLAILLIDLQLKRAIGRQAVTATGLIGRAVALAEGGFGGQGTAAGAGRDDHHGAGADSADVVADPGLAAKADYKPDQSYHATDHRARRARERAQGDGGRAGGTESGS